MFENLSFDAIDQQFEEQFAWEAEAISDPLRSLLRGARTEASLDVGLAEAFAYTSASLDCLRGEMEMQGDCPQWVKDALEAHVIAFCGYSADHLRHASLFTADAAAFVCDVDRVIREKVNARAAQTRALSGGRDVPLPCGSAGRPMTSSRLTTPSGTGKCSGAEAHPRQEEEPLRN